MNKEVTGETVIVKLEYYARADYSSADAFGEVYIPIEVYEENKDFIDKLKVIAYGLDGQYSEIYGEPNVVINTLRAFMLNTDIKMDYSSDYTKDLSDDILFKLSEGLSKLNLNYIYKLSSEVKLLWGELNEEYELNKQLIVNKELEIDGILIPMGSIIRLNIAKEVPDGVLIDIQ